MVSGLFEHSSHTNLSFTYFVSYSNNFFKDHAAPSITYMVIHPLRLATNSITEFSNQYPNIRLKPAEVHSSHKITQHSEKLQCADIVIKFSWSWYNNDISGTNHIYCAYAQVRCTV
ncbi:hypothetical protein [Yersinia phage PY54]|uniref:hypothetical protein n=1 Tax=Yersinia phage PY54 TaxID=172667 RepID=UPI00001B984A|nr:hypothetical protein PY54p29 [Yersinia phage PY54]CAD91790.1 hypothetical protein [Yersinia phage PY54]